MPASVSSGSVGPVAHISSATCTLGNGEHTLRGGSFEATKGDHVGDIEVLSAGGRGRSLIIAGRRDSIERLRTSRELVNTGILHGPR